jgi:hypothetical protein
MGFQNLERGRNNSRQSGRRAGCRVRCSQGRRGEDYVTSANSIELSLGSQSFVLNAGLFVATKCSNNYGLGGGSRHDKTEGERLELTERLAGLTRLLFKE